MLQTFLKAFACSLALLAMLTGCTPSPAASDLAVVEETLRPILATARITATQTVTPSPSATQTPTVTLTPSETPWPEPEGCLRPPDDYERVEINGWQINRRTLAMLEHAARLYGGEIEITGWALTQGSYHDNGSLSFGTHLGGGAVDLSVMRTNTWTVLYEDIEPLIRAMRAAGFAAWLRDFEEVYPGSPIHIHAIAIGDRELSQPAQEQLTGVYGYFLGYTGLPQDDGVPKPDRHGGPVICRWMVDEGLMPDGMMPAGATPAGKPDPNK